jgi:hypothetical protein
MKYLFIALSILSASISFAAEDSAETATVSIPKDTYGGEVLLVNAKEYLFITITENRALEKELGKARKGFTFDMALAKSPEEIANAYNPSNNKPTVKKILARYAEVLSRSN